MVEVILGWWGRETNGKQKEKRKKKTRREDEEKGMKWEGRDRRQIMWVIKAILLFIIVGTILIEIVIIVLGTTWWCCWVNMEKKIREDEGKRKESVVEFKEVREVFSFFFFQPRTDSFLSLIFLCLYILPVTPFFLFIFPLTAIVTIVNIICWVSLGRQYIYIYISKFVCECVHKARTLCSRTHSFI